MTLEPKQYAYVNGRFVLAQHAAVPIADRGFRLGDGLFETIRVAQGVPFQWNLHEHRLIQGILALRITPIEVDLKSIVKKLIHKNKLDSGFVRIAVTRGVGSQGYRPVADIKPTLVIETLPLPTEPLKAATCWLSKFNKPSLSALPITSKLSHGINSTLALLEATDHHCNEALMLSSQGQLCEAASGNIFWFRDGTLYTPTLETGCLIGTTREAILRLSPYPVRLVSCGIDEINHAYAVFLTNCNWGVLPVVSLEPYGWKWNVNEIHLEFEALYQQALQDDVSRNHKIWA